jgi:hypothetical protein
VGNTSRQLSREEYNRILLERLHGDRVAMACLILSYPPQMSLTESIVEDAALAMPLATLTPALSQGERERRQAIRRLNPAMNAGWSESRLEAVT